MSTKYKLFSQSSGDGPKPCAFFATAAGCRNGEKCKFLHGQQPTAGLAAAKSHLLSQISDSSSVSSESGDEQEPVTVPVPAPAPAPVPAPAVVPPAPAPVAPAEPPKKKKNKKRKTLSPDDDIFASPKKGHGDNKSKIKAASDKKKPSAKSDEAQVLPAPGSYAAMAYNQEELARLNAAATATAPASTPEPTNTEIKPKKKRKKAKKDAATPPPTSYQNLSLPVTIPDHNPPTTAAPVVAKRTTHKSPSFRDLVLPVASFTVSGSENAASSPTTEPQNVTPIQQNLPVPTSTPEGRKWQKAVLKTRDHRKYPSLFDFDRWRELSGATAAAGGGGDGWIKPRAFGPWCAENPHAIAIDCEMCETKDPVTGNTNPKALCRVSIVNAVNPEEVLLDTLVKPAWPVVDHREWVNGISQSHLEDVKFTLQHAQSFMMALCSEETVICGHALHNDLVALKMDHQCCVDSALLYEIKDEPGATPSLKDLAMGLIQTEMPDTHDSVNDARVALACLEKFVEKDGQVDPVPRSFPPKNSYRRSSSGRSGGEKRDTDCLFVHRIPKMCEPSHLETMFLVHTSIQPKSVEDIEFSTTTKQGKTYVKFLSKQHARLAFEGLTGEAEPDKSGRLQKKVFLKNGDYVRVRKMNIEKQPADTASATN